MQTFMEIFQGKLSRKNLCLIPDPLSPQKYVETQFFHTIFNIVVGEGVGSKKIIFS